MSRAAHVAIAKMIAAGTSCLDLSTRPKGYASLVRYLWWHKFHRVADRLNDGTEIEDIPAQDVFYAMLHLGAGYLTRVGQEAMAKAALDGIIPLVNFLKSGEAP